MSNINKDIHINRGLEIFLNGGKRKQPKTYQIILNKVVDFLKREVTIYIEFSLNIRKKK
jgi:hypothetical protein